MFGANEIVGQKYFAQAGLDELTVTSMFFTLQGEGMFRGLPAFFIRLTKCNLNCSFCDTYFDSGNIMKFQDIDEKITAVLTDYFAKQCMPVPAWAAARRMVLVLTGGEPMLQSNIAGFLSGVGASFAHCQIESNGTLLQDMPAATQLMISPKCSEKTQKYLTPKPTVLARANALKFVVSADAHSAYHEVPDWAQSWQINTGRDVYVSPMNMYLQQPAASKAARNMATDLDLDTRSTVDEVISFWEPGLLDMAANQRNHEHAARLCMQHGYILNLQLQLYCSLA